MKKENIQIHLTGAVIFAALFVATRIWAGGSGCYQNSIVPCNNAPSKTITCKKQQGSSTVDYQKTVWFNITTGCYVTGNVQAGGTGSTTFAGNAGLEPSQPRTCQAQGNYPDCDGNPTATVNINLTCNTQDVDLNSTPCNSTN